MTITAIPKLWSPQGVVLGDIATYSTLDYILNCTPGNIGVLEITIPASFDDSLLVADGRIGVYRSIDGRPPYLDNGAVYLIETLKYTSEEVFVRAFHMNTLTTRRSVLYPTGSSQANKTALAADNMLRAYWRENAGASIGASREGTQTLADISTLVQTQADPATALGPVVSIVGAHDPLDSVLQRVCDASSTAGTYMTYEIISIGDNLFEFRVYVGARGVDHRQGSTTAVPIILGELKGNLENATLTVDYHNEATASIAGGQGMGTDRIIKTALDNTRMLVSPFHRIERVSFDMTNGNTDAIVQSAADAGLRNGRPTITVGGTLVDTLSCTRGVHYDLGDMLSVEAPRTRELFDVRLELVHEHFEAGGKQQGQELTDHQVQHRYATGGLRSI